MKTKKTKYMVYLVIDYDNLNREGKEILFTDSLRDAEWAFVVINNVDQKKYEWKFERYVEQIEIKLTKYIYNEKKDVFVEVEEDFKPNESSLIPNGGKIVKKNYNRYDFINHVLEIYKVHQISQGKPLLKTDLYSLKSIGDSSTIDIFNWLVKKIGFQNVKNTFEAYHNGKYLSNDYRQFFRDFKFILENSRNRKIDKMLKSENKNITIPT